MGYCDNNLGFSVKIELLKLFKECFYLEKRKYVLYIKNVPQNLTDS